ncbi:MAG: CoA transferase [Conexibacter sp.]|nr:CoA transferase [Conexibacter sp.]
MTDVARAPLADLRIIAIEQFGAGPWGSLQLADLGAEVIKIEDPASGGDVGRYVPPFRSGEDSLFFETFNRSKRSISLDLRSPAGRAVFEDVVEHADAVTSNLRGDQPAKLGLTYEALRHRNPRIVCASLSGFGMTGPRADQPAYDYVLQAMTGWMSLTGEPGGPPTKSGLSLVDFAGGYALALTLLGAVWRARRDGVGGDCDVSLFEVALSLLTYVGTWAATEGHEVSRRGESAHPSIVPFQAFRCADGWITVAAAKQHFWERLCAAMGLAALAEDPRFADFDGRDHHRDELLAILRPLFAEWPADEWVRRLEDSGVPVGRVNGVGDALEDPQAHARAVVSHYEHPRLGTVHQLASPLRISGHDAAPTPGPARGEHTEALLREWCGYGDEDIERNREAGAFGTTKTGCHDDERASR